MARKVTFNRAEIIVESGVFHPRKETEFWVREAVKTVMRKTKRVLVLDIFAGTGCIGISILKKIDNSSVHFVEASEAAIENIEKNLEINRVDKKRYKIIRSDMFKGLEHNDKYDFIFANPPYVAEQRRGEVDKKVLESDPALSLFAGGQGMRYIEKLARETKGFLKKQGVIFMEFDPRQVEKIRKLFEANGFSVQFHKDQFGKLRWLNGALLTKS